MKVILMRFILVIMFSSLGLSPFVRADITSQQILSLSSDAEQLLDLAELHVGQLFSPALNTQFSPPEWLYWRGPYSNGSFIAININGSVYVVGGPFGEALTWVGTFQDVLAILRNVGATNTLTYSQLSGIWWQLVTSDCFFVTCTESAFLYRFDLSNCVENICAGSRQSWIDNGSGWNSVQSLGASFSWTLQEGSIQLSFLRSGRVEIFAINTFNAGLGTLDLSSNDFNRTQLIKCGFSGFPVFMTNALGC